MHFVEKSSMIKVSDNVSVQLSVNDSGSLISPDLQLFRLAPGFNVCLEHRKRPDKCFTSFVTEKSSKPTYENIEHYVRTWEPVLTREAATVSVADDDSLILLNLQVKWRKHENRKICGEFQLGNEFCEARQIKISVGDYACVRVCCPSSVSTNRTNYSKHIARSEVSGEETTVEREFSEEQKEETSSGSDSESDYETASEGEDGKESLQIVSKSQVWVGHCFFTRVKNPMTLQLFHHSLKKPESLLNGKSWNCTVEIIKQPLPHR